jgi:hypothetical protein
MKKVIFLALFLPVAANGQIIENFESGNINNWIQSSEGHWKTDDSESLSGTFSLHHFFDNPFAGADCIGLPLSDLHPSEGLTKWSFLIRHGYDPSSSNNWSVFLMSDTDPGSFSSGNPINGFAAGVNLVGSDDTLRVWKIRDGSPSVVVTCPVNWQTMIGKTNTAKVNVSRTRDGLWSISVFDQGNQLKGTAIASDNELFSIQWLLVNYRYTSSCDRLLWFDDLEIDGMFYEDINPPEVKEIIIIGNRTAELVLDEEPSDEILVPSNFSLNDGTGSTSEVKKKTPATLMLEFTDRFTNKTLNDLKIIRLCDKKGNCSGDVHVGFTPAWAEAGDVIISEIMADPSPPVSLPEKEYIELTNRTGFAYNLKNWILSSGSQNVYLPGFVISPGDFLILCHIVDTGSFSKYGKVLGLKSFPALTDAGRIVVLSDSLGNIIHGLEYSSKWYGDNLKAGGGWSLEMIDTDFPFYTAGNWEASSSGKGGTPGELNSSSAFNPDQIFYGIQNVFPDDSVTITVSFSETVADLISKRDQAYIDGEPVIAVTPADLMLQKYIVKPSGPLEKGKVCTFEISGGITDFAGNQAMRHSFKFGIPEQTSRGQILFNELLFNPMHDDPDFIELYNCSSATIDASMLFLASVNDETGDTSETRKVSDIRRCIVPYSFYVATTDPEKVISRYFTSDKDFIFEAPSLPSMSDDRGHLLLLNRQLEIIDEVSYSEKMHYPLLNEKEGVSLEKVRPDMSSTESTAWHSASESAGFGTPGVMNSSYSPENQNNDQVVLSSTRISPDNDGWEDVLLIDMTLNGSDNIVSISIFNETGGFVKTITENLFAGNKASVAWDGTASDGNLVSRGIYIVLIRLYNDKGKIKTWKKVCAILR